MNETISFMLNDRSIALEADAARPLLWVLRVDLGLTGTKFGCGEGHCGACTVLINAEAVPSCQISVGSVAGAEVRTIEGLRVNGRLHPIQEAFVAHDALQCGFCTPGMILRAYGLLAANPEPTHREVLEHLEDNLCRCGAHTRIVAAVQTAAKALKGGVR